MNFKKDILLVDTEFSGFDLDKHELLQVAAVLLDRKTLKEKKTFNSYIRPQKWKHRDMASMKINNIAWQQVKDAPSLAEVVGKFSRAFKPADVMLASYVGYADKRYLLEAFKKARIKWPFDYHYFDVWSVCYAYLARKNKLGSKKDFAGFGLESMVKMMKISAPVMHDALADCRVEAEVLRQVVKEQ